ncbi:hypothetical protein QFZ82_000567 [Streptomyces sp. V4I23]|nr:hypothetical protein [Streptomyces sp. V4I23]
MSAPHARIWVGVDAGKGHHWAVAAGADGESLFSTKVINDEAQILTLIETARERAEEVRWAVDISGRASALLLALLIAHGQQVVYIAFGFGKGAVFSQTCRRLPSARPAHA